MHYSLKVNFKHGGLCIDSPGWIKKEKATIIPKNTDDYFFQYVATVIFNHEKNGWNPEIVSNIRYI